MENNFTESSAVKDKDLKDAKNSMIISIIICIIWWVSPLDDIVESFAGPLALTDEIIFTILAFIKTVKYASLTKACADTKSYVDIKVKDEGFATNLKKGVDTAAAFLSSKMEDKNRVKKPNDVWEDFVDATGKCDNSMPHAVNADTSFKTKQTDGIGNMNQF